MRKKDMEKCTQIIEGIVVGVKSKGLDSPTIVTVGYEVDGISYQIEESKKYNNEWIKIGFLPVGQKKIPKLGEGVVEGSRVRVSYNPDSPEMAYLTDNVGKVNV